MITIRKLTDKGDEAKEVTVKQAEDMIEAAEGLYFVVDANTNKVLKELKLEDGQSLMLIPRAYGG